MTKRVWVEAHSGAEVDLIDPQIKQICIEDIAWGLSNICRFNGQCDGFYSVAQHSVLLSQVLQEKGCSRIIQLFGLLHDAAEAYLGDVSQPLKQMLPYYQTLEHNMQRSIEIIIVGRPKKEDECATIKQVDGCMLTTEAAYLMSSGGKQWGLKQRRILHMNLFDIGKWNSPTSYKRFMKLFSQLKGEVSCS